MISDLKSHVRKRKLRDKILRDVRDLVPNLELRVVTRDSGLGIRDIRVSRVGHCYTAEVHPSALKKPYSQSMLNYAATWVYWLHQSPDSVSDLTGDVSDGQFPSAAQFAFSSFSPGKTTVPDAYFFTERGYANTRRFMSTHQSNWRNRSDKIVWRGALNNVGLISDDDEQLDKPWTSQRLRLVAKCKDTAHDVKFVRGSQPALDLWLAERGYMGERIEQHSWADRKFALVIDGNTNAWCSYFKAMLMGCCVLRVDSQYGFRQWYYDRLAPFVHFVPVKADLSDLDTQIDWLTRHDDRAEEIANTGRAFAETHTWDSERKRVGEIIKAARNAA